MNKIRRTTRKIKRIKKKLWTKLRFMSCPKIISLKKTLTALSRRDSSPSSQQARQSSPTCRSSSTKRGSQGSSSRKTLPAYRGCRREWVRKLDNSSKRIESQLRSELKRLDLNRKVQLQERTNDWINLNNKKGGLPTALSFYSQINHIIYFISV